MRVLITYQYFLPAYKAGGPIQSINNLARYLGRQGTEVFILAGNTDLDGTILDVPTNTWVDFAANTKVWYHEGTGGRKIINEIIDKVEPDSIFINGLYSLTYTIYPLLYKKNTRKILSVRGMLHPGALSQKKIKKSFFLFVFKLLKLQNRCEYHVTTDAETEYTKARLGNNIKVWDVPNLPNVLDYAEPVHKEKGSLKLVSISLLSPMKNTLLVLKALAQCKADISYSIYGPVKDAAYWSECEQVIKELPVNITVEYMGGVRPDMIQNVLKGCHYFILPSKSENFGHAIYEALSAGRPVVTSFNTPWNGLKEAGAGYNIDPEDREGLSRLLEMMADIEHKAYQVSTEKAKRYISQKYNVETIKAEYDQMFS